MRQKKPAKGQTQFSCLVVKAERSTQWVDVVCVTDGVGVTVDWGHLHDEVRPEHRNQASQPPGDLWWEDSRANSKDRNEENKASEGNQRAHEAVSPAFRFSTFAYDTASEGYPHFGDEETDQQNSEMTFSKASMLEVEEIIILNEF